jgi:ACR3 family arsenite efflux pump ArsB
MGPPGWLVGPAVALGTLSFVLPLLALGMIGLILVPVAAMWAGAAAASIVDSRRRLNAVIVVTTRLLSSPSM